MPKVNGFDAIMTRNIGNSRVFCIIGRNGTAFLQPGRSLGLNGRGTCLRNFQYVPFKCKNVGGLVRYNCNANWSAFRVVNHGNTFVGQESGVSAYGLETYIMNNFPNADDDEFWLFPKTGGIGVTMDVCGNGGDPCTTAAHMVGHMSDGDTRGCKVTGCSGWTYTVCIHSNDLRTANVISNNVRGVYIPYIEADGALGPAGLMPLNFKTRIPAVGSSSSRYGDLMVWARTRSTNDGTQWIGDPVLRITDASSMITSDYDTATELRVETVLQAEG